jgi:hypothetical protein
LPVGVSVIVVVPVLPRWIVSDEGLAETPKPETTVVSDAVLEVDPLKLLSPE